MKGIFLLLGSNLGDKEKNLNKALELLNNGEIMITDYSTVYETEPWGKSDQEWFLNVVVRIDTLLSPEKLLDTCLEIEKELGRERKEKWGERIIDIDILYYDNLEISSPILAIPHPGIADRKFTLIPLVELVGNELHPILGVTQKELLAHCTDPLECRPTQIEVSYSMD
jgi:2-amino-4-hydroxy-6-hydroxymethyldihydropteridine diphosphokinase